MKNNAIGIWYSFEKPSELCKVLFKKVKAEICRVIEKAERFVIVDKLNNKINIIF